MQVNDALVDNLSDLACLEFNDAEKKGIIKDLQRMVSFVEKLNELNTDGILPLSEMSRQNGVLREDRIEDFADRAAAFKNAPDSDESYIKVPKVIRNPSE